MADGLLSGEISRRQFLGAALAAAAAPAFALEPVAARNAAANPANFDAAQVERFLEKFLPAKMKQYATPGALFTLVHDDRIVLSKGYGLADRENGMSVDPARTLVRAYSISKSFTATAVMQQVEAGKLKLDEDINTYLELFKVPDTFPAPVTLAHLLTHTAGYFDTGLETILAHGRLRTLSLGEWLRDYLPERAKPVGAEVEYSNFGMSLAGYVVEVVSGSPFPEYMQQHVLNPLGMQQSSFLWPDLLPAVDAAKVGQAYGRREDGDPIRHLASSEGDFANTPAANLLTTGREIAHFMIAHLNGGAYEGNRILSAAGIAEMHEPWKHPVNDWVKAPNMKNDVGYGFFWRPVANGDTRWMFHTGGWDGSLSDMELIPELKLGYFFWSNEGDDGHRQLRTDLNAAFVERFFPSG